MEELDKAQVQLLKNAFDAFDQEKKGCIGTTMIGTILSMLGHQLDDKMLQDIINEVDADGSGELEFEEFVTLAARFMVEEDAEAMQQELKEAFRLYDKEGNGYITTAVLKEILRELDDTLTNDDLDAMIEEIDSDGSGTVDFDEFMEETKLSKDQLKILKDAFNVFDNEKKGTISLDTIGTILQMLGHDVDEDELDDVCDEFDEDESGEIEFPEFLKLASRYVEPEEDYDELRKELREVFMLYDKGARGYLPLDEFKKILREIDPELPEDELDEIIDEIDADGSGTIDFDEFMDVMAGSD
ncbi:CLUMA_CG019104, isoform A [Clunio marinus]|uniref:CLUMA_CG019104, isoform A n=1 Tax=Clunio marinus TaxID=568069 RepID=A0A1J1J0Q6_9DIPT|nr:CLUMA_CG019104, isoform A [Clunio marinus]